MSTALPQVPRPVCLPEWPGVLFYMCEDGLSWDSCPDNPTISRVETVCDAVKFDDVVPEGRQMEAQRQM